MKGDGNIKILKFIGTGINNNYQVNVKIYSGNNLIFEGITYNGKIKVNLCENKVYRIEARFLSELTIINLYVSRKCKYVFALQHSFISNRTITFVLVDYNYNLPIERGEIILWPK